MNIVWQTSGGGYCRRCSNPGGSLTEQTPYLGQFSTPEECCMDALGYVNTNIQDYSTTVSEECTINNSWVGYNCIFMGESITPILGCTDISALNYNSDATQDDGSCEYPVTVMGCTDINALNYNSDATQDDGSCEYSQGCTDPIALNYDSTAFQDDGSCEYFDLVNDFLFPNQWYMGGNNYCYSGGSMSNFPYPNGCFARGFTGTGNMPEPQMSINWHTGVEQYGFGAHNPIIAVIDDGFDIEHQDLVNQLWTCPPDGNNGACEPGTHGFSFWNNSSNPPFHHSFYTALHGTATSGIIGAEHNGVGTAGICPNCQLMILHTHLGSTADMPPGGVPGLSGTEQAIYFAVANGARVITYSDSYTLPPDNNSAARVIEAIQYAADNNVLFMNAAGNTAFRVSETTSNGFIHGPTNSPESFSIGGFENSDGDYFDYVNGEITGGNAYGVEIKVGAPAMGIIAPTTILPTTLQDIENVIFGDGDTSDVHWWDGDYPTEFRNLFNDQGLRLVGSYSDGYPILFENETDNLYRNFGGTSGATPMVAGLAGLLLSHHPNLTREDLINIIVDSATDMTAFQTIPFNTEISWKYPPYLPYFPYSTSISPEEIPKMINVFSALTLSYNGGFELGDINQDFSVDIQDIVLLTNLILSNPMSANIPSISTGLCVGTNTSEYGQEVCYGISEEICQPEFAGPELSTPPHDPPQWPSEWGCIFDTSSSYDYSEFDLNEDGFIDILDVLTLINRVLNNPLTTFAQQQQLQRQLNRLNVGKTPQDRQIQTLKQLPNDKTRRLFRNVYPLSEEESNMIKDYDLIPNDLKDIDGNIQCLGENNSYPCYWVPLSGINIDVSSDISIPSPLSNENLTTTTRNDVSLVVNRSQFFTPYLFDLNQLEKDYKMTITSDYLIISRCNGITTGIRKIENPTERIIDVCSQVYDGNAHTINYCKTDEIPKFYLHNKTNNREIKIQYKPIT